MNPYQPPIPQPPIPPPDVTTATHADVAAWVDRCADRRARIARQLKIADATALSDFTPVWRAATRARLEAEGAVITNRPNERHLPPEG